MKSSTVNNLVKREIFDKYKNYDFFLSEPVIREINGDYYLAVFVTHYKKDELERKEIGRPNEWVLLDLEATEVLEINDAKADNFSPVPFDQIFPYDTSIRKISSITNYEYICSILDKVRSELFEKGKFNKKLYKEYMEQMLKDVPKNYKQFYRDLSVDF